MLERPCRVPAWIEGATTGHSTARRGAVRLLVTAQLADRRMAGGPAPADWAGPGNPRRPEVARVATHACSSAKPVPAKRMRAIHSIVREFHDPAKPPPRAPVVDPCHPCHRADDGHPRRDRGEH